jgi:hypothetical protein
MTTLPLQAVSQLVRVEGPVGATLTTHRRQVGLRGSEPCLLFVHEEVRSSLSEEIPERSGVGVGGAVVVPSRVGVEPTGGAVLGQLGEDFFTSSEANGVGIVATKGYDGLFDEMVKCW